MTDLSYAAQFPERCVYEVTRRGELEPCETPATGVRCDADGGPPYPVCVYHSRQMLMVPLHVLLAGPVGVPAP